MKKQNKTIQQVYELSQITSETISLMILLRDSEGMKEKYIEHDAIQAILRGLIEAADILDDMRGE